MFLVFLSLQIISLLPNIQLFRHGFPCSYYTTAISVCQTFYKLKKKQGQSFCPCFNEFIFRLYSAVQEKKRVDIFARLYYNTTINKRKVESPMISTRELCEKLGVSRSWVIKYLRPLGMQPQSTEKLANLRTVYYDAETIVAYINHNAAFTRQTEWLNLADYMDADQLQRTLANIDSLAKDEQEVAYWNLLNTILPPGVKVFASPGENARCRGQYPWQSVRGCIKSLDDLSTMATMRENRSEELVYRDNFENGRVRVTVHGRTWFMDAPELTDIASMNNKLLKLIPARGD
jgi:transcriptional regulator with XRE-family HTH domain